MGVKPNTPWRNLERSMAWTNRFWMSVDLLRVPPSRRVMTMNRTKTKMLTVLMFVVAGFAGVDAAAVDSQVCADYKGDNPGTGGDKYTECNAHPDDRKRVVNFVCGTPSAVAVFVEANDKDSNPARAKGKAGCDGVVVAKCQEVIACTDGGTWTPGGSPGVIYDGFCKGGTEEAFDSGMVWSCISKGIAACPKGECDAQATVEHAKEQAERAVREIINNTNTDFLEAVRGVVADVVGDDSLAVGVIDKAGNAWAALCWGSVCDLAQVTCDPDGRGFTCRIVPYEALHEIEHLVEGVVVAPKL